MASYSSRNRGIGAATLPVVATATVPGERSD
jgi:hypothetical protein